MLLAIKAVRDGTLGTNMAARTFSITSSTLKDKISGRVKHGMKSGPVHTLMKVRRRNWLSLW